ncbi:MAG: hypothetical protein JWL60_1295 [Gemmatimonadetes bacterium]|nr:hypothetical protein [Gemmatimonadota bacterium]
MDDTAAALGEWVELSDSLLRGLVHSLNNRITALSAFAELAVLGDTEFTAEAVLPGELVRLQQVNMLFRLLVPDDPAPAALEIGPVLADAVALHAHSARLQGVRCDVVRDDQALPVRAPRWALLRLLVVLLEVGKQTAQRTGRDVTTLRLSGDEAWVTIHVEGALPAYGAMMAQACGADGVVGGAEVRMPTLLEVRRRERTSREDSLATAANAANGGSR